VFEVTDDALRIRGDLFGREIPRGLLRLDEVRVVDLKAGPDRMTLFRTMGVGLPGYLSGWARASHHKEKYLVFLTDRSRVVRIPTSAGYTLLLTPAAPDSFLAALGVAAAASG
jgi:Bacterial PH domain